MRLVNEHAAAHMTARSFSFCHGDGHRRHQTRRGGTTGSVAVFRVVTVSHLPWKWAGLKPPSFPSSGRENVGAVEGEQSVRLSPATARRENPRPFQAIPQPLLSSHAVNSGSNVEFIDLRFDGCARGIECAGLFFRQMSVNGECPQIPQMHAG